MSYEANPNFAYGAVPDITSTITPTIETGPTLDNVSSTGGSSRVVKIIVIVVLVILIIISVILIFVFRGNLSTCENNENPACPILACPVGQDGVVADPDCGTSAFRFQGSKKICSSTRYA